MPLRPGSRPADLGPGRRRTIPSARTAHAGGHSAARLGRRAGPGVCTRPRPLRSPTRRTPNDPFALPPPPAYDDRTGLRPGERAPHGGCLRPAPAARRPPSRTRSPCRLRPDRTGSFALPPPPVGAPADDCSRPAPPPADQDFSTCPRWALPRSRRWPTPSPSPRRPRPPPSRTRSPWTSRSRPRPRPRRLGLDFSEPPPQAAPPPPAAARRPWTRARTSET